MAAVEARDGAIAVFVIIESAMAQSTLTRLWNAIKPPPAVTGGPRDSRQGLNRTQKRMIWGTVTFVVLVVAGWQVYAYVSSAPQRAEKVFLEGMQKMAPGSYSEAIKLFTRATEILPSMGAAYLQRGNAENVLGQTDAALADYDQAITLSNLAAAYTARGGIYVGRGDKKRAEENFTRSIGVEPTSDAYYQRGQIREAAGDHGNAIEDFTQAIHIQPDAPFIYRARALARQMSGDENGAEEDRVQARAIERKRN